MKQKNSLLLILLLFIGFNAFGQTNFQKGYYISLNGNKVEGLINNQDWANSPSEFVFKKSESASLETLGINDVKEFTIGDVAKYIRAKVQIDISSDKVTNLSFVKEPEWESKTLFLRVLLEGGTSLLYYEEQGLKRFLYTNNNEVIQLVYKRYNTGVNKIKENNYYKQQLLNAFGNCDEISRSRFSNISYREGSLISLFKDYNECKGKAITDFSKKKTKVILRLNIGGGISSTSLKLQHSEVPTLNPDFGTNLTYRIALEGEILLPFNNNSWSFFLGVAKNGNFSKKVEIQTSVPDLTQSSELSFKSIEMPFGIRYYIPIAKKSMLSFHLGYLTEFVSEFDVDYEFSPDIKGERNSVNLFIGAGMFFKGIHIEGRYNFNKNVVSQNTSSYGDSKIKSFSIVATYNILNKN